MNNKYQEALNILTDWFHSYKNEKGVTIHERHITPEYNKAKKILQELVDKETSKKVKPFPNSFYIKICPNCGSTLETKRNYCDECGQRLDWSKE